VTSTRKFIHKASLREKAEEQLKMKNEEIAVPQTAAQIKELIHELQAKQIELEIQNQELKQANSELDASQKMYKGIYELAPVGYLTLDRHGVIRKSNLTGANIIGMGRSRLINRQFALFLPEENRLFFKDFLNRIFATKTSKSCELTLQNLIIAGIVAIPSEGGNECYLVLGDITDRKQAGEALAKSEMLYRNLFENSPIGMFQYSHIEKRLLRVNAAYAKMLGYESPEEMMSAITDVTTQIHNDPQNHINVLAALKERDWFYGEQPLLHKDGSVIIAKVAVRKVLKADGTIDYTDGFVEDVTEQRRLEETEKKHLDEITDLYENAPCGYHSSAKDGTILRMNQTELSWLGYSRDEVIGRMKLMDLLSPDEIEHFHQVFPVLMKQGQLHDLEGKFIRKDGSIFHALITVTAIYDENGDYLMDRVSVFNNTERNRAEQALAENEALYRNLFANASIGMFQTTLEGRFLRINKAYATMLGYESPEEVIATFTNTATQLHADPRNRAELLSALEQQDWFYAEQPYLRKDGSIMIGKLAVRKIVAQDGTTSYLEGIVEDITERKKAGEALIKNERELRIKAQNLTDVNTTMKVLLNSMEDDQEKLKERFLDNIKTQVLPYLEKLKKTSLDDVQKGLIKIAETNLDEIASPFVQKLTSNYLNLTKTEIQIASLVREGKTSKEIAAILNSKKRVIDFHRENIRKKLGLNNKKGSLSILLRSYS